MNSHSVRHMRVCVGCQVLGFKQDFIVDGKDDLCPQCAFGLEETVEAFMAHYPISEWQKLPLNVVGVEGMVKLMAALEMRDVEGESNG